MPPRSLLRWEVSLQPVSADVRQIRAGFVIEKLSSRGDADFSFSLGLDAHVYQSPVYLDASGLDFGVCVYGKQYNASFGLALRSSLATATHVVSVEVPRALKDCVWVDQPRVVLNERQPRCSPKLSLRFESKAALTALLEAGGIEFLLGEENDENGKTFENHSGAWDDVYVSSADKFPDSPAPLGADVQPKLSRLRELREELGRVKSELADAQEAQGRAETQLQEALRESAESLQTSGEQKAGKSQKMQKSQVAQRA